MGTESEMAYTWGDNLRNILATITVSAFLYLPVYGELSLMPSKFHEVESDAAIYDWVKPSINAHPYYEIDVNKDLIIGLRIINKFVASVMKGSEDLDPSVAKLINKNFWKLV